MQDVLNVKKLQFWMMITKVKCPHCNFEADYESYLEIMKDQAINMSSEYIPDRPGL